MKDEKDKSEETEAKKPRKSLPRDDPDYSAHPFDDTWRTIVQYLRNRILLLLNYIFGTEFTGDEEIREEPTEVMLLKIDGKRVRRVMDSHFTVVDDGANSGVFHMECETDADGSVILRFGEYDLQVGISSGVVGTDKALDMYLPRSALINLRGPGRSDPMIIRIHDGEQTLVHELNSPPPDSDPLRVSLV